MIIYKITHKHKLKKYIEKKSVGVYSSYELAEKAIKELKTKEGFCDTPNGFEIKKTFRFCKPKLLDKTFWVDGFVTYTH